MFSFIPWNAAFAAKAGAVTAALALGIAMTLASAEASDAFGDSVATTGAIDGTPTDVLGDPIDAAFVQIGTGGSLTISFVDNVAFNGDGFDLRVHTVDAASPATATIEVSADGVTFVSTGAFYDDDAGDINLDLQDFGLSFATAIRISYFSGALPGFDVNAVSALNQIGLDTLVISVAPLISSSPGFTEHAVTATLGGIDPTEGVLVNLEVSSGPNSGEAGSSLTDGASDAPFAWTGENGPSIDVVDAWLDIDGNGVLDGGEPTASAVHEWFGVTGTIGLLDVDGGGLVVGDLVHVTVDDRDLDVTDAPDTVDVNVKSDTDMPGITVTLTETGDHTGVFTGLLELGNTSDDTADILEAVDGDTVTATYDDELDGEGNDHDAVGAFLSVVATEEAGAKATICHRPPGNPGNQHTLSVGGSAVPAHLAHGDLIGECGESDVLSNQEQQQELKELRDAERELQQLDQEFDREQDRLDREAGRAAAAEQRAADRDAAAEGALAAFCAKKGPDHPRCIED